MINSTRKFYFISLDLLNRNCDYVAHTTLVNSHQRRWQQNFGHASWSNCWKERGKHTARHQKLGSHFVCCNWTPITSNASINKIRGDRSKRLDLISSQHDLSFGICLQFSQICRLQVHNYCVIYNKVYKWIATHIKCEGKRIKETNAWKIFLDCSISAQNTWSIIKPYRVDKPHWGSFLSPVLLYCFGPLPRSFFGKIKVE